MAETVTTLVVGPSLVLESKVTLISEVSPGLMGALGGVEVVQPQEACAELMIRSDLPVLVKTNVWLSRSPCITVPKSYSVSLNSILGPLSSLTETLPPSAVTGL